MDANNDPVQYRVMRLRDYLKAARPFFTKLEIRVAQVEIAVREWYEEWRKECPSIPLMRCVDVTAWLFRSNDQEEKLAAIIFIHEYLFSQGIVSSACIRSLSNLFDSGALSTYDICDVLGKTVLKELLLSEPAEMADILTDWFHSENPWKARSAICALIPVAERKIFQPLALEGCQVLLSKSNACTHGGTVKALLALSHWIPAAVYEFLLNESNLALLTYQGLEKCSAALNQTWKDTLRMKKEGLGPEPKIVPCAGDIEGDKQESTSAEKNAIRFKACKGVLSPFSSRLAKVGNANSALGDLQSAPANNRRQNPAHNL